MIYITVKGVLGCCSGNIFVLSLGSCFAGGYICIYGNCNGWVWHPGVLRCVLLKHLSVLSVLLFPFVELF